MTELSIEEKAKRYDEAIKFAYNKHRFSSNLSEIKLIEELFPELRESEDDRIINNIKRAAESYWSDEPLQEILDWLEKQGGKGTNGNEREITISEQKSAEEYNITGIGSKNAQGKLGEMIKRKLEIEKQCEQKPAWNEEDEEIIDYLIDYLESELESSYTDLDKETFTKEINWLKSLKDRFTWKPSDEQIKVLEFFIPYVTKCSIVLQKSKDTLLSLLSDLKKLKDK